MKCMTQAEERLAEIIKDAQSGKYKSFIRRYTGHIQRVLKLKNPLDGSIIIGEIDNVLEILNPELEAEARWFSGLQEALKIWVNEKIIANRLLGLKNDNEYDVRAFEKAVLEKFWLKEKPGHGTRIETDFKTLVDMVELGARRFGH